MADRKSSFLDKVLGRLDRLDSQGIQVLLKRFSKERRFFETLLNSIEDGVIVIDDQDRIVWGNEGVTRLLGLNPQTAVGKPVSEWIPDYHFSQTDFENNKGNTSIHHEFEVNYPRPRFIRMYSKPLPGENGEDKGATLFLHDATEARRKTFEAIESERSQALSLLAASVAHEIGNPLNALHIHLQLMEREVRKLVSSETNAFSAKKRTTRKKTSSSKRDSGSSGKTPSYKLENYLSIAKGEIKRLDYIITQFLQSIRSTQPKFQSASLNNAIRETLEVLGPELKNRKLKFRTRLDKQLPEAPMDTSQIKQVLVNLIKNAMQAMTVGGILLIETGSRPESVWINISDTGGGIASEKINRIFEPFYTTKEKGSGLGLMVVQRIIQDHAGRIELKSDVGKGTSFRIWLPLKEPKPRLLEAPLTS
jgi:PAS domain S-box-containing protein